MLSKNQAKFIRSLHDKKTRNEEWLFLVEWEKSLVELLNSDFLVELLVISEDFFVKHRNLVSKYTYEIEKTDEITKLSTLGTNTHGIAVVVQKENKVLENNGNEMILILDEIKDPGNLGTIVRIADWYGITKIILSEVSVEFYNPKVIISTMGSFTRVQTFYTNLEKFLETNTLPVYWAFMDGENVHKMSFSKNWYLVIWNESKGIGKELEKYITKKITIPRIGWAESLNAGVATAVILDNIKRDE